MYDFEKLKSAIDQPCSTCGKTIREGETVYQNPDEFICDECFKENYDK